MKNYYAHRSLLVGLLVSSFAFAKTDKIDPHAPIELTIEASKSQFSPGVLEIEKLRESHLTASIFYNSWSENNYSSPAFYDGHKKYSQLEFPALGIELRNLVYSLSAHNKIYYRAAMSYQQLSRSLKTPELLGASQQKQSLNIVHFPLGLELSRERFLWSRVDAFAALFVAPAFGLISRSTASESQVNSGMFYDLRAGAALHASRSQPNDLQFEPSVGYRVAQFMDQNSSQLFYQLGVRYGF